MNSNDVVDVDAQITEIDGSREDITVPAVNDLDGIVPAGETMSRLGTFARRVKPP